MRKAIFRNFFAPFIFLLGCFVFSESSYAELYRCEIRLDSHGKMSLWIHHTLVAQFSRVLEVKEAFLGLSRENQCAVTPVDCIISVTSDASAIREVRTESLVMKFKTFSESLEALKTLREIHFCK